MVPEFVPKEGVKIQSDPRSSDHRAFLAAPLAIFSRHAAKECSVVKLRVPVLNLATQRRTVLLSDLSLARPSL